MKARLRLYGTLRERFSEKYPETGVDVEIWENITVAEFVDLVGIPREQVSIISVNDLIAKAEDAIPDNATVKLFQSLHGG